MLAQNKISEISKNGKMLLEQNFNGLQAELSGIVIYPKSSEEIETLAQELDSLGKIITETNDSLVFQMKIEDSDILITISKGIDQTIHVGEAVFKISSFDNLTGDFIEKFINGVKVKQFLTDEFSVICSFVEEIPNIVGNGKTEEEIVNRTDEEKQNLQNKLEEERNARLQLMADFQNFRKRMEEERALFGALANMNLIQDLLEIFDDLNLAMNDKELDLNNAIESIKSAQQKIQIAVEKAGVVRLEIKAGDEFNKDFMEAISVIDGGENMKGKVIAVISSAMKFRDRDSIIKAAKVIVGK